MNIYHIDSDTVTSNNFDLIEADTSASLIAHDPGIKILGLEKQNNSFFYHDGTSWHILSGGSPASSGSNIPLYSLYTDLPSSGVTSGSEAFVTRLTSGGSVGPYYLKFLSDKWNPIYTADDISWILSNPIPALSAAVILTDFTYVIPGGFGFNYSPLSQSTSYRLPVQPTYATDWTSVDIGIITTGETCTVNRMYLARGNNSEYTTITENQATGYVTCISADVIVSGGSTASPKTTWLGTYNISSNSTRRLMIAIQLGAGAGITSWGQNYFEYLGLGWAQRGDERLTTNLSASFNMSGENSFGSLPNIAVKFNGLSTTVVNLPFFGDSHTYGYGDNTQVGNPHGIAGRLYGHFTTSAVRICPLNIGRVGHTTTQFNQTLSAIDNDYDFRAFALQVGSINNISNSLPYSQISADHIAARTIVGTDKYVLPYLAGGADSIPAHSEDWWTPLKETRTWAINTYSNTISGINLRVVNQTSGSWNSGYAYSDGGHMNTSGYTHWGQDIVFPIKNFLSSAAGTSL